MPTSRATKAFQSASEGAGGLTPGAEALLGLNLPLEERFYQQMRLIRCVEERLLELFSKGMLFGTTHTCMGQEANAVGVLNAMHRERDVVWSSHRCHGQFIAYCGQVEALVAEIMGRETGVCGGRGGSQHLCLGNFHSSGVQGGFAPIAVGCAMARKGDGAIVVAFLGDGAMGEGTVYESLNLASILGAPVLFVVEDNEIAQTTPKALTVAGSIAKRAEPFGVESFAYDGADVLEIHALARGAVDYVREGGRPAWLYLRTERLGPHSKGDETRPVERMVQARARDPLPLIRDRLAAEAAGRIDAFCREAVDEAVAAASAAPLARP